MIQRIKDWWLELAITNCANRFEKSIQKHGLNASFDDARLLSALVKKRSKQQIARMEKQKFGRVIQ